MISLNVFCFVVRQVELFVKGEKKGNGDLSINKAVMEAERALLMSIKEREGLIKCVPSDDEDDDAKEQMEVEQDAADNDDNSEQDDSDNDVITGRKVPLQSTTLQSLSSKKWIWKP